MVERKGDKDQWVAQRLVDDLASWGCTEVVLETDGEPSIVALQKAMAASRQRETIPVHPPACSPQSNGNAERAVQEFSSQLRSLKLALESRIKVAIGLEMEVMKTLADYASYLICRCLRGTTARGYESSSPILRFGSEYGPSQ